ELNQIKDFYTNRPFLNPSEVETKVYLKEISEFLVHDAVSALRFFDDLVYIPVFREIRKTSDDPKPSVFDGNNIIDGLRKMQSPNLGKEEDEKAFLKLQAFVRKLLGLENLTI